MYEKRLFSPYAGKMIGRSAMKSKTTLIFLLTCCALLLVVSPALAEEPFPTPSDDEVNAIAANMYCPVCENIPLDVCPTAACAQWREEIRDKLSLGWSEQEIYDYFALKYGDRVLAEPPRQGFNWLAYIVPPVAFIIGAYILYRGFQTWRRPVEELVDESPAKSAEGQDEYLSQLEKEVERRK
jgi:cytochrome c-type biogenesis protein CcmH